MNQIKFTPPLFCLWKHQELHNLRQTKNTCLEILQWTAVIYFVGWFLPCVLHWHSLEPDKSRNGYIVQLPWYMVTVTFNDNKWSNLLPLHQPTILSNGQIIVPAILVYAWNIAKFVLEQPLLEMFVKRLRVPSAGSQSPMQRILQNAFSKHSSTALKKSLFSM